MKIRHLIPLLLAAVALVSGCADEDAIQVYDEIQVSSSYIGLPVNGGSVSIDVTAKYDWSLTLGDDDTWFSVSATSGSAGTSTLTFSADATESSNESVIYITCSGKSIRITVTQTAEVAGATVATVAEVLAGADGTSYNVTATVISISSTYYGNIYVNDGTSDTNLYIYGLCDAGGNYPKDGANWDLEDMFSVGDIITVEGPRSTYGSVVELVDATLVSVTKSLISVDSICYVDAEEDVEAIPLEGGEAEVYLTVSGTGLDVSIDDDAKDWLSISNISNGGSVVTFRATENDGGDRSTTVAFYTYDGDTQYTAEATISQTGAIIDATIAEFNEAEVGDTYYRLSGIVTSIASYKYGNCYIQDYTGSTYVYGLMDAAGNYPASGDNWELGVGYMLTLTGQRGVYGSTIEVLNPTVEELIDVTEVTIAEFLEMEDADDVFYMVTGTISSIYNDKYGNLYLTDDSTDETLYVYGCYGYGASDSSDKQYFLSNNGIEEGDTITLVGYKTTYNGVIEMMNGYYVTHTAAE